MTLLMLLFLSFFTQSNVLAQEPDTNTLLAGYKKIYLRSEWALKKFDKKIEEENTELFALPEYQEILALRQLRHEQEERIYSAFLDLQKEPATKEPSSTNLYKYKLSIFLNELNSQSVLDQVIFHDLKNKLHLPLFFQQEKDLVDAVIRTRPLMQEMGSMPENSLSQEISENIPNWDIFPENFLPIKPSPGPEGNLTGRTFPNGTWALTFDDGPHPVHTPRVLENLKKNGIKASFFWLAENVQNQEKIVKQVKAAGMNLANHSYSHPQLSKAGYSTLDKEINYSTAVETAIYGSKPRFFRCPYGDGMNNRNIREMIADQGMVHVFWNVDTLDWQDKNPSSILARTKTQMNNYKKGIILFHDIHNQSVEASRMLIENTKKSARWVSMQQITDELNK